MGTRLCLECEPFVSELDDIFDRESCGYLISQRAAKSLSLSSSFGCPVCPLLNKMLEAEIERYPSRWKPDDPSADPGFGSDEFQVWSSPYIGSKVVSLESLFDYPNDVDAIGVVVATAIGGEVHKRMRRVDHHSHQGFILPTTPVSTDPGLVTGYALK